MSKSRKVLWKWSLKSNIPFGIKPGQRVIYVLKWSLVLKYCLRCFDNMFSRSSSPKQFKTSLKMPFSTIFQLFLWARHILYCYLESCGNKNMNESFVLFRLKCKYQVMRKGKGFSSTVLLNRTTMWKLYSKPPRMWNWSWGPPLRWTLRTTGSTGSQSEWCGPWHCLREKPWEVRPRISELKSASLALTAGCP